MDSPPEQKIDAQSLEALKAANRAVFEKPKLDSEGAVSHESASPPGGEFFSKKETGSSGWQNPIAQQKAIPGQEPLVETLFPKFISLEQERAGSDRELAQIEASLTSLMKRKKELEGRRSKLINIREKIVALGKEINEVLSSKSNQP